MEGAAISPIPSPPPPVFQFLRLFSFPLVWPRHAARCPWTQKGTIELVNNQDKRIIESKRFRRTGDIRFMIDLGGRD